MSPPFPLASPPIVSRRVRRKLNRTERKSTKAARRTLHGIQLRDVFTPTAVVSQNNVDRTLDDIQTSVPAETSEDDLADTGLDVFDFEDELMDEYKGTMLHSRMSAVDTNCDLNASKGKENVKLAGESVAGNATLFSKSYASVARQITSERLLLHVHGQSSNSIPIVTKSAQIVDVPGSLSANSQESYNWHPERSSLSVSEHDTLSHTSSGSSEFRPTVTVPKLIEIVDALMSGSDDLLRQALLTFEHDRRKEWEFALDMGEELAIRTWQARLEALEDRLSRQAQEAQEAQEQIESFDHARCRAEEQSRRDKATVLQVQYTAQRIKYGAQEELRRAQAEARKAVEDADIARAATLRAREETRQAHEAGRQAREEARQAHEETYRAREETRRAQEETHRAQEETHRAHEETKEAQVQMQTLQSENDRLRAELLQSRQSVASTESAIIDQLEQQLDRTALERWMENGRLHHNLQDAQTKIRDLEDLLKKADAQVMASEAEISHLNRANESNMTNAQSEIRRLGEELEGLKVV